VAGVDGREGVHDGDGAAPFQRVMTKVGDRSAEGATWQERAKGGGRRQVAARGTGGRCVHACPALE
jgi:hypothetical protein